jgi:hypothetical protein
MMERTLADLAGYFLGDTPPHGASLAELGRSFVDMPTRSGRLPFADRGPADLDYARLTGRGGIMPRTPEMRAADLPPTDRLKYWAMDMADRLWGADRYAQQRVGDMAQGVANLFVLPALADAAFHAQRGDPANTMMASIGAIPGIGGPIARAAEKEIGAGIRAARSAAKSTERAMDEASRATRTEEMAAARKTRDELFDLSNLGRIPDIAQVDIVRYAPPRGVSERVVDLTSDRRVRDRMLDTIAVGEKMGGPIWYNTWPLREAFISELGKARGEEAFRKYMDFVAATSPRSEVGANVRNASYYYSRLMSGEGMPAVGGANPKPYGHLLQQQHQMNARRVAGEGWNPLNNPKSVSFVENLVGNQTPVTVDTHAFRLPAIVSEDPRFLVKSFRTHPDAPAQNIRAAVENGGMEMREAVERPAFWQAQPRANEYGAMEQYYQSLAKEVGLRPAQAQASAWIGGGEITGLVSDSTKPFLGFLQDRVMLTARKTGLEPREVLKRFIRGQMPLMSVGAGAAATFAGPDLPPTQ